MLLLLDSLVSPDHLLQLVDLLLNIHFRGAFGAVLLGLLFLISEQHELSLGMPDGLESIRLAPKRDALLLNEMLVHIQLWKVLIETDVGVDFAISCFLGVVVPLRQVPLLRRPLLRPRAYLLSNLLFPASLQTIVFIVLPRTQPILPTFSVQLPIHHSSYILRIIIL